MMREPDCVYHGASMAQRIQTQPVGVEVKPWGRQRVDMPSPTRWRERLREAIEVCEILLAWAAAYGLLVLVLALW